MGKWVANHQPSPEERAKSVGLQTTEAVNGSNPLRASFRGR